MVVLAVAMLLPLGLTWLYFVQLVGQPPWLKQSVYAVGKCAQFALPVMWLLAVRRWPTWRGLGWRDAAEGSGTALVLLSAIVGGYVLWLRHGDWLGEAGGRIAEKLAGFAVDTPGKFFALAAFYALLHSLLEEYYWRWFVFGQLRRRMRAWLAVWLSALAFTLHHVVLVTVYFGNHPTLVVVFSGGVLLAGVLWAWQYDRHRSLWAVWLSHLAADAAIFYVAYDLVHERLG